MNLGAEYIKYRWNAIGRHGIHSPFVYDFVDKCLKIKLSSEEKALLEELDSRLKKDRRTITVQDFGAGSHKMGETRIVRQIYRWSSSKGKYGELLYKITRFYKPKRILELGTSLGVGTCYLSIGNPDSEITTVEGCDSTREIAMKNFNQLELKNINSVLSDFASFLSNNQNKFDLVFIDGHHDGEALIEYLLLLEKCTNNDTLFILDDIRWSASMRNAWIKIKNDSRYNVSIDLFRVGLITPRNQQQKEHFVIRY